MVSDVLRRYAIYGEDELAVQNGVEDILAAEGIEYVREWQATARDRPDFWLPDEHAVIECKVDGSTSEVERQLSRYASIDGVLAIVLLTTMVRHSGVSSCINGVPVDVVCTGTVV